MVFVCPFNMSFFLTHDSFFILWNQLQLLVIQGEFCEKNLECISSVFSSSTYTDSSCTTFTPLRLGAVSSRLLTAEKQILKKKQTFKYDSCRSDTKNKGLLLHSGASGCLLQQQRSNVIQWCLVLGQFRTQNCGLKSFCTGDLSTDCGHDSVSDYITSDLVCDRWPEGPEFICGNVSIVCICRDMRN